MQKKHVIVVGAGASGLMAAITAARAGCKVTVLEHTSKIGRKIEVTGNGKCNYTNEKQELTYYHSQTPEYVQGILNQFSYEQTVDFFEQLGIVPRCKNGYFYPYSGQAQAVSSALRMEAEKLCVKFACNIDIQSIQKKEHMFYVAVKGYQYEADAVILATGSMAAPATGSDGSGYALAEQLGHRVITPLPALVHLVSRDRSIPLLSGLRTEGSVTLLINGENCGMETGELQFVKNGLSGISVFQLSGRAAQAMDKGAEVEMQMDFLKVTGWESEQKMLMERKEQFRERTIYAFLNGLVHEKVQKAVCSRIGIKGNGFVKDLGEIQWKKLTEQLCAMKFTVCGTTGYEQAQVCSGGVDLKELKEGSLESKLVEQLYFAGELLDVDGACGGYNLQWAWASGYVAGMNAAKG